MGKFEEILKYLQEYKNDSEIKNAEIKRILSELPEEGDLISMFAAKSKDITIGSNLRC